MNRAEAFHLLKQRMKKENLVKHCLSVESCMREFALEFGEEPQEWELAGLLHDLDYEETVNDPSRHGLVTEEILKPFQLSERILHAIKAHNGLVELENRMDIALYTIDPTTGFIIACALMHPSRKLEAVSLKRMKKRFKEKNFAKGANREQIMECTRLGLSLDEFLTICQRAMYGIHEDLGL